MRGKLQNHADKVEGVRITPADAGKTCQRFRTNISYIGSPPRMRGKPKRLMVDSFGDRITPADAGKTCCRACTPCRCRDHPRGCGENLRSCHFFSLFFRITPADAGKTLKRSFRNQPFCSRAVQISFNFSNSLNVSLQSGSAR